MHKLKDNLRIFHELAGPVFPPPELRSTFLVQVRNRSCRCQFSLLLCVRTARLRSAFLVQACVLRAVV